MQFKNSSFFTCWLKHLELGASHRKSIYWPGLNCGWLFKSTQINPTVNIKENLSCCENENSIKCKFDLKNYVNEFDVNEVREN